MVRSVRKRSTASWKAGQIPHALDGQLTSLGQNMGL